MIPNILLFIGANSTRANIPPPLSPQNQKNRPHSLQQPGLPVSGYEANLVGFSSLSQYQNI